MNKVCILGTGGIGDCLQSIKAAYFIEKKIGKGNIDIRLFIRKEVFNPINYLYGNLFSLYNHIELNEESIIKLSKIGNYFGQSYEETLFLWPDTLFAHFSNKYAGIEAIKQVRLLTHEYNPENVIYLALHSSTNGYVRTDIIQIIKFLSYNFPSYLIYYANLKEWAGKILNSYIDRKMVDGIKNIFLDESQDFIESLKWLKKACFVLCTDNGIMHLAHDISIPYICLDPQFGKLPFITRWKNYENCIPFNTEISYIIKMIQFNLDIPATQLFDRKILLDIIQKDSMLKKVTDWQNLLLLKY